MPKANTMPVFAGEVLEKYFDSKKDQLITPKYDDKSFDMTAIIL